MSSGYRNYLNIITHVFFLMTTDLTLGKGSNPAERQVEANADDSHNPHGIAIVSSMVSENDVSDREWDREAE